MDDRYKKIFYSPISNIMQKLFPRYKIHREGRDLVAIMMSEIHAILIKNFESECESEGNSVLRCVQAAVSKSLPTDIRRHALADANRKLLLFQKGLIVYDYVSSLKRFAPPSMFKDGIKGLISATGATSVLQLGDSDKKMAKVLSSIVDLISTKVAHYSSRQNVTEVGSEHVMEVLEGILPKNLFEHAKLRGYSSIRDFELGLRDGVVKQAPKRKKSGGKSPSRKRIKSGRQHSKGKKHTKHQDPSTVFTSGNKKVLSGLSNGESVRLSTEANEKVSQALCDTASFLSSAASDHVRNQKLEEMDFLQVKEVMNELFSRNLFEHAVLCGFRNVNNFIIGELKYRRRQHSTSATKSVTRRHGKKNVRPKKSLKSKSKTERKRVSPKRGLEGKAIHKSQKTVGRSKPKRKSPKARRTTGHPKSSSKYKARRVSELKEFDFTKGISAIFTILSRSPSASMGREGKERLNSLLTDVLRSLIQESSSLKSPMTPETVRSAAEKILPRQIKRHATAYADQKVGVGVALNKYNLLLA